MHSVTTMAKCHYFDVFIDIFLDERYSVNLMTWHLIGPTREAYRTSKEQTQVQANMTSTGTYGAGNCSP